MTSMRLQKYLATAGICSRRQGEKYITDGRVSVNGKVITELGTRVETKKDKVEIDGQAVTLNQEPVYIALNKPKGYVSSCKQKNDKTVVDLVDVPQRVYPIGRLDKDSTGLLILTNDGRLHHRLSHPSFNHEKEYEVGVAHPITDGALKRMEKGLPLMGTKTRPAETIRISSKRFRITLKEGKNRQIRRMTKKVGSTVKSLRRIRISNITLDGLDEGQWRFLTEAEKRNILQALDTKTGE